MLIGAGRPLSVFMCDDTLSVSQRGAGRGCVKMPAVSGSAGGFRQDGRIDRTE